MIEELFIKYKKITREMIEELKNNNDINDIIKKREILLEEISKVNISGKQKEICYKKLGIDKDDADLELMLKKNIEEIKLKIKKAKTGKEAFSAYSSANRQDNLFSRHV